MPQIGPQQLAERVSAEHDRARATTESGRSAAEALSKALEDCKFEGWDPYDALSSPALRVLARLPVLRQLAIQGLKRCPVNARPLLGIPQRPHAKADALFVSSYVRLDACGLPGARALAWRLADRLEAAALETGGGVGWGYGFDVQTRWGYYRAGTPNAIVTSFAALAFVDLHGADPQAKFDDLARGAVTFVCSDLLGDAQPYFSYTRESTRAIHNANVLVAEFVGRCSEPGSDAARSAADAIAYTVAHQRDDGSWPYGEGRGLEWVDGFHTGYVLGALRRWHERTADPEVGAALQRGLDFYVERLIEPDGLPRASTTSRFPVDIHAASTAIWTLAEAGVFDPKTAAVASRVLDWTLARMRRPDGRYAFQLHPRWRNSIPYVRWSDAHMLLGLASFLLAAQKSRVG
jgi:hypothetical protein